MPAGTSQTQHPANNNISLTRLPSEVLEIIMTAALKNLLDQNLESCNTFIDRLRSLHLISHITRADFIPPLRKALVHLDHQLADLYVERVPIEHKLAMSGVALYNEDPDEGSDDEGDYNKSCTCSHPGDDDEKCYVHSPSKRAWEALNSREHKLRVRESLMQSVLQRIESCRRQQPNKKDPQQPEDRKKNVGAKTQD